MVYLSRILRSTSPADKILTKTGKLTKERGNLSDAVFTRLHLHKRIFPLFAPQFGLWVISTPDLNMAESNISEKNCNPHMGQVNSLLNTYVKYMKLLEDGAMRRNQQ
ncbi:hypothetical protein PHMEG_00038885 [Phytophthora megakarya]|uniref:Uncharacterized protein n=1 Tax=Phytophthora megakarya TaxID=4795 RepID=A0A225UGV0_9STRA|nr:hypothetical protein PHMEG_00038885 [Phytophthora megakarya]